MRGRKSVQPANPQSITKRYRHVLQAARNPIDLDELQVNAVAARMELDLRIGYAFTRFLTNSLRPLGGPLAAEPSGKRRILSYGMPLSNLNTGLISPYS